jgi:hypothetical protein
MPYTGHRYLLYLENGEDIGSVAFGVTDWKVGDTFKSDGTRYEILNVLDVPEEMNSEYAGIWTVTPRELAEPG